MPNRSTITSTGVGSENDIGDLRTEDEVIELDINNEEPKVSTTMQWVKLVKCMLLHYYEALKQIRVQPIFDGDFIVEAFYAPQLRCLPVLLFSS